MQGIWKLLSFENDDSVLDSILAIKKEKKRQLADYLKHTQGVVIDENSIFDIQVKRLHEYKRQT